MSSSPGRLKADGRFRLVLAGGMQLARVRMYHSLHEIWDGFTKNLFAGTRGNPGALLAALTFMAALTAPSFLALCATLRRRPQETAEALAATAAVMAAMMRGIAMVGMPRKTALLQPLGTSVFIAITVNSTWRVLSGRGVMWRGRRYSGRRSSARPECAHAS